MSELKDGYYDGEILDAWPELRQEGSSELMACFGVDLTLPDGSKQDGVARHFTEGDYADITRAIFDKLELPWPAALKDMTPCIGKTVRVRVKSKQDGDKTYQNFYIVTSRPRKPASTEQVAAAVAKLEAKASVAADDEPLPF